MWNLKEREAISTKYERGERFQVLHDKEHHDNHDHNSDNDEDSHDHHCNKYDDSHDHEHYSDGDNDLSENLGGSASLPEHRGD